MSFFPQMTHFEEKVVKKREFSSNDIHFEENFLFRGKATVLEENGKASPLQISITLLQV